MDEPNFFIYLAIGVIIYLIVEETITNPVNDMNDDDKYGGK